MTGLFVSLFDRLCLKVVYISVARMTPAVNHGKAIQKPYVKSLEQDSIPFQRALITLSLIKHIAKTKFTKQNL